MGKKKDILIESFGEQHLASNPEIGALSFLNPWELIAFQLFQESPTHRGPLQTFFEQFGGDDETASVKTAEFLLKMKNDGWLRHRIPEVESKRLQVIYFTVTLDCNLFCPYCYQGQANRIKKRMSISDAEIILDRIKEINSNCHIVVTGGEPFIHKKIFDIIEKIQEKGFHFTILTNGTLINQSTAERLVQYSQLTNVQVSIDGMTEKTHAITRGESFKETMAGILYLINYEIPFSLAPTIHEGNLHELYDLAFFAYSNNGTLSPNNLRVFPHCAQHELRLTNETLYRTVKELDRRLLHDFGEKLKECKKDVQYESSENLSNKREKFICGMAHSIVDINWNGDVFPCHLLREKKFILGNLLTESFETIFQRVEKMGIRVFSYDIPKCKECKFVSTCGGGCRAGSYYNYGSFMREDNLCEILYKSEIDKLRFTHSK